MAREYCYKNLFAFMRTRLKEPGITICEKDLGKISHLLGKIAVCSGSLEDKRRLLITGLSKMVEADGWIWTVDRVDHKINTPMQLVDDETWYNNANTQTYFLQHGVDHCMYAITPFENPGFSGIGFFRITGCPPFSERQRRVVHVVTTEVRWLYDTPLVTDHGPAVEALTPRLRSVLTLLLDGYLCKEIADLLHLSPHTVKGYIRDIYRHFNVKSQLSLIRLYRKAN